MQIFIIAGFNVLTALVMILTACAVGRTGRDLVREKRTPIPPPPPVSLAPGMAAAFVPPADPVGMTSYSRVAGLLGVGALTSFFWALGNVILRQAFIDPSKIGEIVTGCEPFFLAGSALFAPYAFNQLSSVFHKT